MIIGDMSRIFVTRTGMNGHDHDEINGMSGGPPGVSSGRWWPFRGAGDCSLLTTGYCLPEGVNGPQAGSPGQSGCRSGVSAPGPGQGPASDVRPARGQSLGGPECPPARKLAADSNRLAHRALLPVTQAAPGRKARKAPGHAWASRSGRRGPPFCRNRPWRAPPGPASGRDGPLAARTALMPRSAACIVPVAG